MRLGGLLLAFWTASMRMAVVSSYEYFLPSKLCPICLLTSSIIFSVCPLRPAGGRNHSIPFSPAHWITSLKSHKEACLAAATSCSFLSNWNRDGVPLKHMNLRRAIKKLSVEEQVAANSMCAADVVVQTNTTPQPLPARLPWYSMGPTTSTATDWNGPALWFGGRPILCSIFLCLFSRSVPFPSVFSSYTVQARYSVFCVYPSDLHKCPFCT